MLSNIGGHADIVKQKQMDCVRERAARADAAGHSLLFASAKAVDAELRRKLRLQFEAVYRAFRSMDDDKSGHVCAPEFKEMLRTFNLELRDDAEFAKLFAMYDQDRNGFIDYREFMLVAGEDIQQGYGQDGHGLGDKAGRGGVANVGGGADEGRKKEDARIRGRFEATGAAARGGLTAEIVDAQLRERLTLAYPKFRGRLAKLDGGGKGYLTKAQTRSFLASFGYELSDGQFDRLLRFYARETGAQQAGPARADRVNYNAVWLHSAASPHYKKRPGEVHKQEGRGSVANVGGRNDPVKLEMLRTCQERAARTAHASRQGCDADAVARMLRERARRAPDSLRKMCRERDPVGRSRAAPGTAADAGGGYLDTQRAGGGAPFLDEAGFASLLEELNVPLGPGDAEFAALVSRFETAPGSRRVDYERHLLPREARPRTPTAAEMNAGQHDLVKAKCMALVAERAQRQDDACRRRTTAAGALAEFRQRLLVQSPQFARACKAADAGRAGFLSHGAFRLLLAHSFQIEPSDEEYAKMVALPEFVPTRMSMAMGSGQPDSAAPPPPGCVNYMELLRRFGDMADSPISSLPIYGDGINHLVPKPRQQQQQQQQQQQVPQIAISPINRRAGGGSSRASSRGSRGSRGSSLVNSARMSLSGRSSNGMPTLNMAAMSPQARAALTARSRRA